MNWLRFFTLSKLHIIRVWSLLNIVVQFAQLTLLLYVTIKTQGHPEILWLLPILGVLSIILLYLDWKHLMKAEINYTSDKTDVWIKLNKDVEELKTAQRQIISRLEEIKNAPIK